MRLGHIAKKLDCELVGQADIEIRELAPLDQAGPHSLAGLFSRRWSKIAQTSGAAAIMVEPQWASCLPRDCARLLTPDPRTAWANAIRLLYPHPVCTAPNWEIHPLADVEEPEALSDKVHVGAFVHIGSGASVGTGSILHAGAYIGRGAFIGEGTVLMPHAQVLDEVRVGAHCWIGPGAILGSQGFGIDAQGRIPHVGGVSIGAHCSIGAHVCIDRGTVGDTSVGDHCHLDNLVQVGHNVRIGAGVVICGQVGIAGGVEIDDGVVLGGQAGINGHVHIASGIRIAAQAGVTHSLKAPGDYSGHPAEPNGPRLKRMARLRHLAQET